MTLFSPKDVTISIAVLDERLHTWGLPSYQSEMAAGMDLRACIPEPITVLPRQPAILVSAGFSFHLAEANACAFIVPRSGNGHKGLVLGNGIGMIDPDYTGEIFVSLWNRTDENEFLIEPGQRIAQLVVMPIFRVRWQEVSQQVQTKRSDGGFGSTGQT